MYKRQVYNDKIGKYNFKGGYNLHGFMDLNLSKEAVSYTHLEPATMSVPVLWW